MKVSEITIAELKEYLKVDDDISDILILNLLSAAIAYIKGQTGMSEEEIDTHDDLIPAVYVLVSDLYDNREYAQKSNRTVVKPNIVVRSILDMYCKTLL